MIWSGLGTAYRDALWQSFDIPNFSDLCCYWFKTAGNAIRVSEKLRVGLLATQGIRGKTNRSVLDDIKKNGDIFYAWADKNWILDGATVHVSIVAFDSGLERSRNLDGKVVKSINADLSSGDDLTQARLLAENQSIAFIGTKKAGKFDLSPTGARELLRDSANPTDAENTDVVKAWVNGSLLTRRWDGSCIIDFGGTMTLPKASEYAAPMRAVEILVKPDRAKNNRKLYREKWWLHAETRPGMRRACGNLHRMLATTRVSKHRLFSWLPRGFLPDDTVFVFARTDDFFFGSLNSAIHEIWSRKMGTQLREAESGFRYTPTTCFETFPLPWPPGKEDVKHPAYQRIAAAAMELNDKRERWLNPPEWIEQVAARVDAADQFEDVPEGARALIRQSAIMAAAAKDGRLKNRTLTKLYNERPTWLKLAHETLDRAVLAAYAAIDPEGNWSEEWAAVWVDSGAGQKLPEDHPLVGERARVDQTVLGNLLRMNQSRAG